ncbi:MAG TPA: S8 family serine peptidase, partial [Anaerolineae bacterium]|nr:S8 family serine peptidase [Anaerolineae bacterium]
MKRAVLNIFLTLALTLALAVTAFAQDEPDRFAGREVPESVEALKLDTPVELSDVAGPTLDRSLIGAEGESKVIIRLSADSVAEAKGKGKALGLAKKEVDSQQDAFLSRVYQVDPNARVVGEVQLVLNAVFLEVDSAALPKLAQDPAVVRIAPVADYELDLSETVPQIGAAAVQAAGIDGSGVRVAVLDSGIDYYHAALGGSGDPADYAADDPTIIEAGTFPTAKVVGGYDFTGSVWPAGPELPDPDPLDDGPEAGHGTHVGHIVGGVGGVAPGADLYAVKVCSSISTACSGVALIQGMEFAADPDGDGDPADHVDVINMSLGSDYGQPFDDDLAVAVDNATSVGILTVASAGNGADKPYVNGTPASAATALSVAQTQVTSAALQLITVGGVDYPAVFQPWSVPPAG